jgi:hypothetical protein
MSAMRPLHLLLTPLLAANLLLLGPAPVRAGLISTEAVVAAAAAPSPTAQARERIERLLQREDVRRELEAYGVSPAEALARVASLSDAEIAVVAGRLDALPAGGDSVAGVLLIIALVFILLIVFDYVGITDIFPWVNKPAQRRVEVPSPTEEGQGGAHAATW